MSEAKAARGYLLVTVCYWMFTLSDGALRMLVLLHLHAQGETAWGLALLLLPYEAAGVVTNLFGGYLGMRVGLKPPLCFGLALQAIACAMLAVDQDALTVAYIAIAQLLSGVAKDLAKTSAKSYVRLLAPNKAEAGLFGPVAFLTGSKNTIKGIGFFVGGALLASVGFQHTNVALAILLAAVAVLAVLMLPQAAGKKRCANGDSAASRLLKPDRATFWLSLARTFLFGSRDAWFAIALPLYLVTRQWSQPMVGAFLAGWVIVYGALQAMAPRMTKPVDVRHGTRTTTSFTALLLLPLAATATALACDVAPLASLIFGLCAYGAVFAVTSSLHSWLIVAMHQSESTPERVGFYYSANALGRLLGTLVSGACFQAATPDRSLVVCLLASCGAVVIATACTARVRSALAADRAA